MNLEEELQLNDSLEATASLDITISKEPTSREEAMTKLAEYEELEKENARLSDELKPLLEQREQLMHEVQQKNPVLFAHIETLTNVIQINENKQSAIKDSLLPLQRELYNKDSSDKILQYNQVKSTYVAPTEKNSFDLKKFREEQVSFWNENLSVLEPYSKISKVSDYIKMSIK